MSAQDVDGLNSGYARLLLEDYLENPDAVPAEWRELFESGDSALVASHPGLLRLVVEEPEHELIGRLAAQRIVPARIEPRVNLVTVYLEVTGTASD